MKTVTLILTFIFSLQYGQVFSVTGGEPAAEGEFPFMVSIRDPLNCHSCGGTIIGDRWILTSSLCILYSWHGAISFGTVELPASCSDFDHSTQRSIDYVIPNPNAENLPPYTHDLVIIHLNESIPFSDKVQPIQIPELDEIWPFNRTATILGWGESTTWHTHTHLQKAEIPLFSDEYCRNSSLWDGWYPTDPVVMKCGGIINETYYCNTDYGGPVIVDGIQYGILSYIFDRPPQGCGQYLGIFSPVSYFRDWIKDTTGI